MMRDLQCQLQK